MQTIRFFKDRKGTIVSFLWGVWAIPIHDGPVSGCVMYRLTPYDHAEMRKGSVNWLCSLSEAHDVSPVLEQHHLDFWGLTSNHD